MPKSFVKEPFCVSENFWYRKILGIREGAGITIFRQNCFCLTVPNRFAEETFCAVFQEISDSEKVYRWGGGGASRFFVEIVLSHSTQTFRRGTLLCFRKFRVSKNFMPKRGTSRFSIEKLFSRYRKTL